MLLHDLQLAVLSFRRNPGLTALMVSVIAVGIGAAMVFVTIYHAQAGNPIWWKNDQLFAVAIDNNNIDPRANSNDRHPDYPSLRLTHRDASALFASDIPTRKAMMYRTSRILEPDSPGAMPTRVNVRLTTADFFAMFEVPFQFGGGWTSAADDGPEPVAVLSKPTNNKVFNGANSVGRTLHLNGRDYRVIGVLDTWQPFPKFYDMNLTVGTPEDIYLPLRWGEVLELFSTGNTNCLVGTTAKSFKEVMKAECMYLQFWAEVPSEHQLARYRQFVDAYVLDQKSRGRFPRPLNNRVANVSDWLAMNDAVLPAFRMILWLAAMFLAVCVLNTLGMMLTKFLGNAQLSGLRRALGASRRDIFRQHVTESVSIAMLGGVLGLALTGLGLYGIRTMYSAAFAGQGFVDMAVLTRLDSDMLLLALGLALIAGLLGGLYPAWRICRMPPTVSLKSR